MKTKLFFLLLFLSAFTNILAENLQTKKVHISFKYEKQFKLSSNQFAVWIENENNELIKNIFVTRFTAVIFHILGIVLIKMETLFQQAHTIFLLKEALTGKMEFFLKEL